MSMLNRKVMLTAWRTNLCSGLATDLHVQEHVYLGRTGEPTQENKIHRRIRISKSGCGRRFHIMADSLPHSSRQKVYNRCILIVQNYRAETWRITKKLERNAKGHVAYDEKKIMELTLRSDNSRMTHRTNSCN